MKVAVVHAAAESFQSGWYVAVRAANKISINAIPPPPMIRSGRRPTRSILRIFSTRYLQEIILTSQWPEVWK
jgi:hypothetical protein